MSDGHATADLELSTSDTAVPSRADKTHVPEPSAATLIQDGSTKGSEPATGQTFVVESPPAHQNGRDAAPAESQTLIATPDGGANETDGDYRFGATVVADGAAGQDHDFGATLVGENIGVGNGDEFHMGATIAGGDDPAARATRVADVVNSLDPAGPAGEFELQPGESLIGRFRVLKVLGEGSFGAVYLAEDPQLDRRVAIKVTKVGVLTTRSDVDRFQREAKAAAQLRHPNIVPVYEVGRIGRSSFLAYEFIDGHTLGSRLKEAKKLPAREAAQMMHAISGALGYAHELGIIHRDMKPDNVLVDKHGQPHIADFGLARRDSGEMDKTREGGLMGTPLYMSPEQASGRSHEADARADVWSLGVMLREMLTGVLPFQGKLTEILIGIQTTEPPSIRTLDPSLPKDLETICQKCLSKDPALRYANGTELAAELDRYLRGEPILARPLSMPARMVRWAKRNPKEAFAAGLIVALLLGISIVSTSSVIALKQKEREKVLSWLDSLTTATSGSLKRSCTTCGESGDHFEPLRQSLASNDLNLPARNRMQLALVTSFPNAAQTEVSFDEVAESWWRCRLTKSRCKCGLLSRSGAKFRNRFGESLPTKRTCNRVEWRYMRSRHLIRSRRNGEEISLMLPLDCFLIPTMCRPSLRWCNLFETSLLQN
ncbi:MAG: serine/threonine-protein kinase [Planctomycetaceae bacterium]